MITHPLRKLALLVAALILGVLPSLVQAQWQQNGSHLYHTNGNVGIDINSPARELHIFETQTGTTPFPATIEANTSGLRIEHHFRQTPFAAYTPYRWDLQVNKNGFSIYDREEDEFRLAIDNDGRVGIGLTAPTHRLEVDGNAHIATELGIGGPATNRELEVYGSGNVTRFLNVGDNNAGIWARLTADNSTHDPGGPEVALHAYGNNTGVASQSTIYVTTHGALQDNQGIYSFALGECIGKGEGSHAIGVFGEAAGADRNIGIHGRVGVAANCPKGGRSYAIWGYSATNANGNFAGYFDGNTFCTSGVWSASDRKLKREVRDLEGVTEQLMRLQPKSYQFRTEEFPSMNLPETKQYGFLAQELQAEFPEMTMEIQSPTVRNKDGIVEHASVEFTGVNYQALIPMLVQGFQEQQQLIESQAQEIEALKAQISGTTQQKQASNIFNETQTIGTKAVLGNNIPNPFEGITQIPLFIPDHIQQAQLIIFDMTGKQLQAQPISTRGHTSIQIDAESLAAGMYIYTLIADGREIDSKRMILNPSR
ncbi:MAG: tail fiber domain-containing protein [Bacteroidota bacterium]